jgi:hypothetical protein
MAKPQRTLVTPREYEIGVDITVEQYHELIKRVGDWFVEFMPDVREPNALAQKYLDACIKGVTPKTGAPWFAMANSTLAARMRSSCRFDIDKMEPIRKGTEKYKLKHEKERRREARKKLEKQEDNNIPDELREELRKTAVYGDNPHVHLSSAEHAKWQEIFDSYIKEFPTLDSINARQELSTLCDLHIHLERERLKLLKAEKKDPYSAEAMSKVSKQISELKSALGIHPDQLAKLIKQQTTMTIGTAAAKLQSGENWRDIRMKYFAEELIQALQMTMTVRADGAGYQLDEPGFFALTRCRKVACPDCGTEIVGGFRIQEAIDWLVDKGHLTELPPVVSQALEPAI